MTRLTRRELWSLLDFVRGAYEVGDIADFAIHVISGIRRVVPSEIASYNEVDLRQARRPTWVWNPANACTLEANQVFERHMSEHPLITHYQRTRDGRALKISDFLADTHFRRLGLYGEYFRPMGIAYQLAVALSAPRPFGIAVALSRGGEDFSDRERTLLDLARPHLIQAYRNAKAVTRVQQELRLIKQGVDELEAGVIVLSSGRQVLHMSTRARTWMAEYFGSASGRGRLPEPLRRWVMGQEARLAVEDEVPPPLEPLSVKRPGKRGATRLVVRLLSRPGQNILLLDERQMGSEPAPPERSELTRRESEVLAWLAEGKTNAEIGAILGTKPRTVAKHLERIYQKIGVETRTAAVAHALRAAGHVETIA